MEQISTKSFTRKIKSYLNFLIDPRFQEVNRLFIKSFENEDNRKVHTGYYLPKVEIKNYNVMIDGKKHIWKMAAGQGDYYTAGCVLGYNYFNNYYNIFQISCY